MKPIGLHEIRKEFLDFFKEKEHLIMPSFSLVPKDDKSLLLIGAGMAPMKKYFTGELTPPAKRIATSQKCIRTGDIENVGRTARHATFFEMLGNFSFGDYFKKEAIEWAWEFLTEKMEIPQEDLWVSIYYDDDEAYEIWNKDIHVPGERIVRLGKEDNFWELEVGPSGPCSEIHVDRGIKYGCGSADCKPGCDCDRFLEVWNLVFTQFDKDSEGNYHPLDHPNIDTGMGLERIAAVLEGADTIFEVKEIQRIVNKVEKISKYKYNTKNNKDVSIRVITDHVRAMTFLVSDGVLPSNEGRGYILRRLIRRAARHGKLLGIDGAFLTKIVDEVINSWKVEYEDLTDKEEYIKRIIKIEEEKFQSTIDQGIEILDSYIQDMISNNKTILSGSQAFKLYDTYGFPIDLTKEILEEKDLKTDEVEFNSKMEEQRERARKAREGKDSGWKAEEQIDGFSELETKFEGYTTNELDSNIIALVKDSQRVDHLNLGDEGIIVLSETPFYGESGGQVGDTGIIETKDAKAEITDTQYTSDGLIIHIAKVVSGELRLGDQVRAQVNDSRRNALRRYHTATHLLHKALKEVLGAHVNQAGSIVLSNRLRFDFTHFQVPTRKELKKIEKKVNEKILEAIEVKTIETSLVNAKDMGAVGLFEDKYMDQVRIISIGDFSMEFCGGTHVNNTANIGLFKIISESGIASGIRRIEAITGMDVYNYMLNIDKDIDKLSNLLKTNKSHLYEKAKSLIGDIREKDKEIESLEDKLAVDQTKDILQSKTAIKGVSIITHKLENMDMNALRGLGDEIRNQLGSGVIVLASVSDNKLIFLSMVTKDLVKEGISAGNIVKEIAKLTGGNGGGRPDMAQAGGKDISKLDDALSIVPNLIDDLIG